MPPIELIKKRIANISVGPSTVRGQPKETVNTVRLYFNSLNLQDFSNISNEVQFKTILDKHTLILKDKLPSKSWGISRKVLNIFLFQVSHDIILNRKYHLDKIISYLELPLDNPNAKRLKRIAKDEGIKLDWSNIYSLEPEVNAQLQEYAQRHASHKYRCERCYLDIYWWRSEI